MINHRSGGYKAIGSDRGGACSGSRSLGQGKKISLDGPQVDGQSSWMQLEAKRGLREVVVTQARFGFTGCHGSGG